jgi:hypothetical protein
MLEEIQQDLDNGKFGLICSNETTFKNYVSKKFQSEIEKNYISRAEVEEMVRETLDSLHDTAFAIYEEDLAEFEKKVINKAQERGLLK